MAFPPFEWTLFSYVALLPLFFHLHRLYIQDELPSFWAFFKVGFVFGAIFMGALHVWIFKLSAFAPAPGVVGMWLVFTLYLASFYGLFSGFLRHLKGTLPFYVLVTCLFTLSEYLRQLGPFGNPTGLLGYSQVTLPHMLQLSYYGGVFFVSLMVVLFNILFFFLFQTIRNRQLDRVLRTSGRFWVCYLGFMILFSLGYWRLGSLELTPKSPAVSIGIIQGNHVQKDKLNWEKRWDIHRQYAALSEDLLAKSSVDIVFFPETITSAFQLENKGFLRRFSRLATRYNSEFIFGTPLRDDVGIYNGIGHLSADSHRGVYRKTRLMPFGEYWPFRSVFIALGLDRIVGDADYITGHHTGRLISVANSKIGASICLESIYPHFSRRQALNGADFLVTLTNNAWFFDSAISKIHFNMGRFRAVENNRYWLQVANTGVSGIVDNFGRVLAHSAMDERWQFRADIPLLKAPSVYMKWGDWVIYLQAGILLLGLFIRQRQIG